LEVSPARPQDAALGVIVAMPIMALLALSLAAARSESRWLGNMSLAISSATVLDTSSLALFGSFSSTAQPTIPNNASDRAPTCMIGNITFFILLLFGRVRRGMFVDAVDTIASASGYANTRYPKGPSARLESQDDFTTDWNRNRFTGLRRC